MIKIGESGGWAVGMIPTGKRAGVYFYGSDIGIRRMNKGVLINSTLAIRQLPAKSDLIFKYVSKMPYVKEKDSEPYAMSITMSKWKEVCEEFGKDNVDRLHKWYPAYRPYILYGLWHYGEGFPAFLDKYPTAAYSVLVYYHARPDKMRRIFNRDDEREIFEKIIKTGIWNPFEVTNVDAAMVAGKMLSHRDADFFMEVSTMNPAYLEGGPISKTTGKWKAGYGLVLKYIEQASKTGGLTSGEKAAMDAIGNGALSTRSFAAAAFYADIFGENIISLGKDAFTGPSFTYDAIYGPSLPEFSSVGNVQFKAYSVEDNSTYTVAPITSVDDALECGFHIWSGSNHIETLRLASQGKLHLYSVLKDGGWSQWFAVEPGKTKIVRHNLYYMSNVLVEDLFISEIKRGGEKFEFRLPTKQYN